MPGQRVTILEYGKKLYCDNAKDSEQRYAILCWRLMTDWWRGRGPAGQEGIFPSSYVRKVDVTNEKAMVPAPFGAPPPYDYQQQAPQYPQQQYAQPPYGQQQYDPQPMPIQEEKRPSKLAQFGKNYGKTFVNATAW
jgi:hypothetical protein